MPIISAFRYCFRLG